ncbi:MurR/RpiR family transcriptional regulator [Humitalea sp. 24SJ18S-53]|uniref:MurR/RpiR family transcriptional regulator n=1 Tax=Humitalea sp. 24SJ18S-53 TaxID=3422307 RepID=UPI003D66B259
MPARATIRHLSPEMVRRITLGAEKLGDRGRAVASLLLSNPAEVALLTATKVAERLQVSESTVVRFAQAIGYTGYPDLRRDLQEHVRQYLSQIGRMEVTPATRGQGVAQASLERDLDNLRSTMEQLDQTQMRAAVRMLGEARRVYVFGVRSVFGLADMLAFHLRHLVEQPIMIDPARGMRLDQLAGTGRRDVLIAMSFPRYSRIVHGALQIVREQGGRTVVFTDSPLSPLATLADALFTVSTKSTYFGNSLVGASAIVNALLSELLSANKARSMKSFKDYERFISDVRHIGIDGDEDSLTEWDPQG